MTAGGNGKRRAWRVVLWAAAGIAAVVAAGWAAARWKHAGEDWQERDPE